MKKGKGLRRCPLPEMIKGKSGGEPFNNIIILGSIPTLRSFFLTSYNGM